MQKIKRVVAYLLTLCMALSLVTVMPEVKANPEPDLPPEDTYELKMMFVNVNDKGEVEYPKTYVEGDERWLEYDENDNAYSFGGYNHCQVAFAKVNLGETEDNVTLITDDVSIYEANRNDSDVTYTIRHDDQNNPKVVAIDDSSIEHYRYWDEKQKKDIVVPGVYNFGLWQDYFIVEYKENDEDKGLSMVIRSDRPFIGIYEKHTDNNDTWYDCVSWDKGFEYSEDDESTYYFGLSVWLNDNETVDQLKERFSKFDIIGISDYVTLSNTVEYDNPNDLVLRQFTMKQNIISKFEAQCEGEFLDHDPHPALEPGGQADDGYARGNESIRFSCRRDGLAIAWDDDGAFRTNYYDYQRCFDELSLQTPRRISIGIASEKDGKGNVVPVDDKEKLKFDGPSESVVIYTVHKDDDPKQEIIAGLYDIYFPKNGVYTMTYADNVYSSKAEFVIGYPGIGLYNKNEISEENFLCAEGGEYIYTPGETVYLLTQNDVNANTVLSAYGPEHLLGTDKGLVWDSADENSNPISFKIPEDEVGSYDIGLNLYRVDKENKDNVWENRSSNIRLKAAPQGLVIADPNWDGGYHFEKEIDNYEKEKGTAYRSKISFALGISGESENVSPVNSIENLSITKVGDSDTLDLKEYIEKKEEDEESAYEGLFDMYFPDAGEYILTYTDENEEFSSSVKIIAELPSLGIYGSKNVSDEKYVGDSVAFDKDNKTWYILADESGDEGGHRYVNIQDASIEDGHDVFIDYKISKDKKSIEVKLDKRKKCSFAIKVIFEEGWMDADGRIQDINTRDSWFRFEPAPELLGERTWYLDGEPQTGYSGRWILKGDFDGTDMGVTNDEMASYWVHADTMQGVIDKLSETEIGEDFDGYYLDTETGEFKKIEDTESIFNTGYIEVCPSSAGDIELQPQYVASSGNFKGIRFHGYSSHACFVPADKEGNYKAVTGKSGKKLDYLERVALDAERILDILDDPVVYYDDDEDKDVNLSGKLEESDRADLINAFNVLKTKKNALSDSVITKLKEVKYVYLYDDKIYPLTKNELKSMNRDLGENLSSFYFTISDRNPICQIDGIEDFLFGDMKEVVGWTDNDQDFQVGELYTSPCGEIRVTESVAGLHVNVYCDMVFDGDMKNLVVGYPKDNHYETIVQDSHDLIWYELDEKTGKPLIDPQDNYEEHFGGNGIFDLYRIDSSIQSMKIMSPRGNVNGYLEDDLFNVNKTIYRSLYDDGNLVGRAEYHGRSYEYNVKTYTIDTVSDVSDSGKSMGLSVVAPEPNSIKGLSFAQKDAIETGKKLTVSVDANDLDTESVLTADEATAISEIDKVAAPGNDTRVDYIDFDVKAKVEGVNEETTVTDLHVPLWITMKIPGGYKKGLPYSIARYHDGKVDTLTLKDNLLGEVAGLNIGFTIDEAKETITFLADRFSVYALVREGGKTAVDLSKVKWDYTEAFTEDGTVKKVALTGLPEGVIATYTGNEASTAGKYTAKASLALAKDLKLASTIPDSITTLVWEIKEASKPAPTPDPDPTPTPDPTPISEPIPQPETPISPAPVTPAPVTSEIQAPKKNAVLKDSKKTMKFKVTKVGTTKKAGEVTFTGPTNKNNKSLKVPKTVKVNGVTFKVTAIAANAFKGNKKLTTVTIPESVKSIGDGAFMNCVKLKIITLPKNVASIGKNAFKGCKNLKNIIMKYSGIPKFGTNAFLNVPSGCRLKSSKAKVEKFVKAAKNASYKGKFVK